MLSATAIPTISTAKADWMSQMIQQQNLYQRQGNAAVNRLYNNCMSHPGACQPAPGALDNANRQLQNQYNSNLRSSQHNYNTQYRTINRYDDVVIKGCQYWRNPYTGQIYTNNLSCR
jgi:hypothetical protein